MDKVIKNKPTTEVALLAAPLFEGGDTQDGFAVRNTSSQSSAENENKTLVDIKRRGRMSRWKRNTSGMLEPWKKGESGNPRGRPKKAQNITDQLAQEAKRKVTVVVGGVKYTGRNMEILAKRMFERGIRKVEPRMCSEIIDRVDGRAVSSLELVGRNGEPIKIVVAYDGNIIKEGNGNSES